MVKAVKQISKRRILSINYTFGHSWNENFALSMIETIFFCKNIFCNFSNTKKEVSENAVSHSLFRFLRWVKVNKPLHAKCPNTKFFLVRIYLDWIQENTEQKKLRILDTFHAVVTIYIIVSFERIYEKAFFNWLYQDLLFFNIFLIDFFRTWRELK